MSGARRQDDPAGPAAAEAEGAQLAGADLQPDDAAAGRAGGLLHLPGWVPLQPPPTPPPPNSPSLPPCHTSHDCVEAAIKSAPDCAADRMHGCTAREAPKGAAGAGCRAQVLPDRRQHQRRGPGVSNRRVQRARQRQVHLPAVHARWRAGHQPVHRRHRRHLRLRLEPSDGPAGAPPPPPPPATTLLRLHAASTSGQRMSAFGHTAWQQLFNGIISADLVAWPGPGGGGKAGGRPNWCRPWTAPTASGRRRRSRCSASASTTASKRR